MQKAGNQRDPDGAAIDLIFENWDELAVQIL